MLSSMRPGDITVGEHHRRDMGDIEGLARSIEEVGLLHPVVVTPDGRLIAGRRRLMAASLLGWEEVAVRVVDLEDIARGEFAENVQRKDFTPSEAAAIARALEPGEREAARERQAAAGPAEGRGAKRTGGGNFPQPVKGKTRDKVAAYVGMSGRTLEKARKVVEAAEESPERFGPLAEEMDRTGKVEPAYRALRVVANGGDTSSTALRSESDARMILPTMDTTQAVMRIHAAMARTFIKWDCSPEALAGVRTDKLEECFLSIHNALPRLTAIRDAMRKELATREGVTRVVRGGE